MMNKTALCLLFPILVLITGNLHAQASSDVFARLEAKTPGQGSVSIKQDAGIRNMVNLHLTRQRSLNGIWGYKICIYIGSGQEAKKEAELTRSRFLNKYESVKCDWSFEYPFWKVYVGAFRTKSEALMFMKQIKDDYPKVAFIRDGIVSFPD
jgi:hypothetical protein